MDTKEKSNLFLLHFHNILYVLKEQILCFSVGPGFHKAIKCLNWFGLKGTMTGVHPRITSHDMTIERLQGFLEQVGVVIAATLGEDGETKPLVNELHARIDVIHLDGAHRWL